MIIEKHTLVNVNDNFNQKRYYFVDNYPNTINMYLIWDWYKIFNNDAFILSDIFNYKLFEDSYSPYLGNICCGFPEYIIKKIQDKLDTYKINYNIIDIDNNSYEYHDFEDENNYLKYINENENEKNVEININSLCVEIGDTVTIKNLINNEIETYTIMRTYYNSKPVSVSRDNWSFGAIEYKDEIITENDIDKGEILSISPFAKALLGLNINDIVILKDKYENDTEYMIIDIIKEEKKYN